MPPKPLTSVLKSICIQYMPHIVYIILIKHDFVIKLTFFPFFPSMMNVLNAIFFGIKPYYNWVLRIMFTQFNNVFNFEIETVSTVQQALTRFDLLVTSVPNDNLKFSTKKVMKWTVDKKYICTKCVIDGRITHRLHTQTTKRTD